jgi:hypothetical protein
MVMRETRLRFHSSHSRRPWFRISHHRTNASGGAWQPPSKEEEDEAFEPRARSPRAQNGKKR